MRAPYTLFGAAIMALVPVNSVAFGTCDTYKNITDRLKNQYKEVRVLDGVSNDRSSRFELWAGKSDSWTFFVTQEDCLTKPACTCVVAAGQDIRLITDQLRAFDNGRI